MDSVNKDIKLSIALVTRNRPSSLLRTLESLHKELYQPYEVIISDDSDLESSIITNKELCQKYNCIYKSGPRKGLYANRNFVARSCNGTHIRTMDDDHEFPKEHFKKCIEAIENDYNAIWTIGEYYPEDKERPLPAPIPGQLHPRGYSVEPGNIKKYYGISCGASIYPKSIIENNILNNESYKFGILYLEYGARLFANGFTIKHLDSTYVIHHFYESSISSSDIIDSARIFSMLMFSFYLTNSIENKFQTVIQILKELITHKYSIVLFIKAYRQFKKESTQLKLP